MLDRFRGIKANPQCKGYCFSLFKINITFYLYWRLNFYEYVCSFQSTQYIKVQDYKSTFGI